MPSITLANPVIIVPIYRDHPSEDDYISLDRLNRILGKYEIAIIGPPDLRYQNYQSVLPKARFEPFPKHYFQSTRTYNELLVSSRFYKRLNKYSHALIAQTDSYVFADELELWCSKELDYVGAPWFNEFEKATEEAAFLGVGNGGFSLRRIAAFRKALQQYKIKIAPKHFLKSLQSRNYKSALNSLCDSMCPSRNLMLLGYSRNINEDWVWGKIIPSYFPWFRVPNPTEAANFSFEMQPSRLLKMTKTLPFGCHAWKKYEPEFWQTYIPTKATTICNPLMNTPADNIP